jgi:hypothetical protein
MIAGIRLGTELEKERGKEITSVLLLSVPEVKKKYAINANPALHILSISRIIDDLVESVNNYD